MLFLGNKFEQAQIRLYDDPRLSVKRPGLAYSRIQASSS